MDPGCFIKETFFFKAKVPTVDSSAFLSILVGFDDIFDAVARDAWHDDEATPVEFQLALKQTRLAQKLLISIAFGLRVFALLCFSLVLLCKLLLKCLGKVHESLSVLLVDKSHKSCALMSASLLGLGGFIIDSLREITARFTKDGVAQLTEGLHEVSEFSLIGVPADIAHKKRRVSILLCLLPSARLLLRLLGLTFVT